MTKLPSPFSRPPPEPILLASPGSISPDSLQAAYDETVHIDSCVHYVRITIKEVIRLSIPLEKVKVRFRMAGNRCAEIRFSSSASNLDKIRQKLSEAWVATQDGQCIIIGDPTSSHVIVGFEIQP